MPRVPKNISETAFIKIPEVCTPNHSQAYINLNYVARIYLSIEEYNHLNIVIEMYSGEKQYIMATNESLQKILKYLEERMVPDDLSRIIDNG